MPISKEYRKKLRHYYALTDVKSIRSFELTQIDDFLFWSRKTWVRFLFVYANNEQNRRLGRVGRISGFRIATRNLDLVPTADRPLSRNPKSTSIRYYDVTRANAVVVNGVSEGGLGGRVEGNSAQLGQWRSFRRGEISIMVEVWSFERQQFGPINDFTTTE